MTEKARREKLEHATANILFSIGVSVDDIAKIMGISVKAVEKLIGNIKNH